MSSITPASRYIKALPDKHPNISLHCSRMSRIIMRCKPGQQLHIPRSHSASFDRAFSVQGQKLWNSLPAVIRYSKSIIRFQSWNVICSTITKTRENYVVYVTAPLQLSDAGAGVVFGRKLDRPWLSLSVAFGHFRDYLFMPPSAEVQSWGFDILEPDPPAFRVSELIGGVGVRIFRHFLLGFSTGLNYSHWDSCVRWFMGVKYFQIFIQIRTPRGLEIIARWGNLPISMALRSEESLKSEMLSLARTSKYLNNTNVQKQHLRGR